MAEQKLDGLSLRESSHSAFLLLKVFVGKRSRISSIFRRVSRFPLSNGHTLWQGLNWRSSVAHFHMDKECSWRQTGAICLQEVDVSITWDKKKMSVVTPKRKFSLFHLNRTNLYELPVRRLVKGRVNCPTKSFLTVWSWSSTTKRTRASSGTWSWKPRVQSQRGLKPAGGAKELSKHF